MCKGSVMVVGGEGWGGERGEVSVCGWQWRGQNLVRLGQNVRSISKKCFLFFLKSKYGKDLLRPSGTIMDILAKYSPLPVSLS